jgi:hypothetical protein
MVAASAARAGETDETPAAGPGEAFAMTVHERFGHLHAVLAIRLRELSRAPTRGQGTVEYVGLILLIAVLIAGVVQASHSFKDTGIAEAVVKKIKGAIDGVSAGR